MAILFLEGGDTPSKNEPKKQATLPLPAVTAAAAVPSFGAQEAYLPSGVQPYTAQNGFTHLPLPLPLPARQAPQPTAYQPLKYNWADIGSMARNANLLQGNTLGTAPPQSTTAQPYTPLHFSMNDVASLYRTAQMEHGFTKAEVEKYQAEQAAASPTRSNTPSWNFNNMNAQLNYAQNPTAVAKAVVNSPSLNVELPPQKPVDINIVTGPGGAPLSIDSLYHNTTSSTPGYVDYALKRGAYGMADGMADGASYGDLFLNESKHSVINASNNVYANDPFALASSTEPIIYNNQNATATPQEEVLARSLHRGNYFDEKADSLVESYTGQLSDGELASGNIVSSLGRAAPAIVLNAFAPGAGAAYTFGTSAGGGTMQALNEGASVNDALAYGTVKGASDAGVEFLFNGVGGLGRGLLKNPTAQWSPVARVLGNAGIEGLEGATGTYIDPYLQRATYNPNARNATLEEVLGGGLEGALMAAILGGGNLVVNGLGNFGIGQTDVSASRIENEIQEMAGNTQAEANAKNEAVLETALNYLDAEDAPQNAVDNVFDFEDNRINFNNMENFEKAEIAAEYAQRSPLEIPEAAKIRLKSTEVYDQIAYTWKEDGYLYEVRWHTETANAPQGQGATWVVHRKIKGQNGASDQNFFLLTNNTWATGADWFGAIDARRKGEATPEHLELLNNGHWRDE